MNKRIKLPALDLFKAEVESEQALPMVEGGIAAGFPVRRRITSTSVWI